jgi:7-cyano-7-deazaguanine synthase
MANLATRAGVEAAARNDTAIRVRTPLLERTKGDIVRLGLSLGVDYGETTSCYDPVSDGAACGHCDACQLRLRGFAESGIADPAPYADRPAVSPRPATASAGRG